MTTARVLGAAILTVVYFACIPLHIVATTQSVYAHSHHPAGTCIVAQLFHHLGEMTNMLSVVAYPDLLNRDVVCAYLCGCALVVFTAYCVQRPLYRNEDDTGTLAWLSLHSNSPPLFV